MKKFTATHVKPLQEQLAAAPTALPTEEGAHWPPDNAYRKNEDAHRRAYIAYSIIVLPLCLCSRLLLRLLRNARDLIPRFVTLDNLLSLG